MDGKEESLGLYGHHVCNGEPPDKAETFLVVWRRLTLIKKIVHFSVDVKFWSYGIVTLEH